MCDLVHHCLITLLAQTHQVVEVRDAVAVFVAELMVDASVMSDDDYAMQMQHQCRMVTVRRDKKLGCGTLLPQWVVAVLEKRLACREGRVSGVGCRVLEFPHN